MISVAVGLCESHYLFFEQKQNIKSPSLHVSLFDITAARLMSKYNSHGSTDVTGYGLLGHANNLAKIQKNEVGFVIHNLPVIAKMAAVSKACGNMFGLMQGTSAETSGEWNTEYFNLHKNPLNWGSYHLKFHLNVFEFLYCF